MPFLNSDGLPCGLVREVDCLYNDMEKVPVPLKAVHVQADVVDFLAEVTVRQAYVNMEGSPIEAAYLFPVEPDSGVVHFEAELDGHKVEARLRERKEAKKEYDKALAKNKTAFLLEETRDDLFQIRVGQLKPGAEATIMLRYVIELPAEQGHVRLAVPSTIAPRYTPPEFITYNDQTGEAALKVSGVKYTLKTPGPMTIELNVKSSTKIKSIESPSHKLRKGKQEKDGKFYTVRCSLMGIVSDMDRDFVALIKTKHIHRPRVLLEEGKETFAALVSLVPSFDLKEQPSELVFLVDRSGSMMGPGIKQAKKALQLFLHSLPPDCLFNIVSFGSHFNSLFEDSVKYDDTTLAHAKAHVASMEADYGGTEIFAPLEKILKAKQREKYARQVFVLTDGSVFNDKEVIAMVRGSEGGRVFSLGLGACSKNLVKGIARAGNGNAVFAADWEDLRPRVMVQLKNALQPTLKVAQVDWIGSPADMLSGGKTKLKNAAMEAKEMPTALMLGQCPAVLPPVYSGSRLLAYRIFSKNETRPKSVRIVAVTSEGELSDQVDVERSLEKGSKIIHQLAGKWRLADLEDIAFDLTPVEKPPLSIDDVSSEEGDHEDDKPQHDNHLVGEAYQSKMEARKEKERQRCWERKQRKYKLRLEKLKKAHEAEVELAQPAKDKIKAAMVDFALKYGLASSVTSFVAVDPRDPKGEEYAEMQTREVPQMVPAGYAGQSYGRVDANQIAAGSPMEGAPMDGGYENLRGMPDAYEEQCECEAAAPMEEAPRPRESVVDRASASAASAAAAGPTAGHGVVKGGLKKERGSVGGSMHVHACTKQEERCIKEDQEIAEDQLNELIDLQKASGNFSWGRPLEKYLGLSKSAVLTRQPSCCKDEAVWVTLLAVAIIEDRFPDQKELWDLVVAKAIRFARDKLGGEEQLTKARKEAGKFVARLSHRNMRKNL